MQLPLSLWLNLDSLDLFSSFGVAHGDVAERYSLALTGHNRWVAKQSRRPGGPVSDRFTACNNFAGCACLYLCIFLELYWLFVYFMSSSIKSAPYQKGNVFCWLLVAGFTTDKLYVMLLLSWFLMPPSSLLHTLLIQPLEADKAIPWPKIHILPPKKYQ